MIPDVRAVLEAWRRAFWAQHKHGKSPEIVSTAYAAGFDAGALFERRKREAATAD